ncbi:MAG: acyltransferase family protein [Pirellulales bacterium]
MERAIFLPFLFLAFRSRSLTLLFATGVVTTVCAWAWVQTLESVPGSGRLSVIGYAPCFVAGVIAWRLAKQSRPVLPGWLWPVILAFTTLVWFASDREHNMCFRWGFCFVLGLAIPLCREIPWWSFQFISKTIAKYSYGIYLWHTYCMMIAFRLILEPSLQWPVFAVLMVIVPYLIYHWIEKRGIDVGKHFSQSVVERWHSLRVPKKTIEEVAASGK